MTELKTCPFCGSVPHYHEATKESAIISCVNPDCIVKPSTDYRATKLAIEAWNRRA